MKTNELTYTADDLNRAKKHNERTRNGVYFDWWLAGPNGAGFMLFQEPHHTVEDIDAAKRELRRDRDVVTLRVAVAA